MSVQISTIAFIGATPRLIKVQVQIAPGMQAFNIVGLADKAVAESRERVRAAFAALGLDLPYKRIVINLAPADLPKEGAHYDLPIALGLMAAMDALPADALAGYLAMGELSLDGSISAVPGALPAAIAANTHNLGLICPHDNGPEAAWAGDMNILAAKTLIQIANHFKGTQTLSPPIAGALENISSPLNMRDVRGQETAKRALELAASGGHNLLMVGPPGAGKSMLAARLPGILPHLTPQELLETSMIHSLAGLLVRGQLNRNRPFRSPHHSASMAAMVGGGNKAKPGEASLAHCGVLFLDELPEFTPQVLDSLRQPLEVGEINVARANAHVCYPARFQLIAAMNPCRCGAGGADGIACKRGTKCAIDYQTRVSGPFMDRMDIQIDIPPVTPADLALPPTKEGTQDIAERVANARAYALTRNGGTLNAHLSSDQMDHVCALGKSGQELIQKAAETLRLSARAYHRILRMSRTLADLDGVEAIGRIHVAEALTHRRSSLNGALSGGGSRAPQTNALQRGY